MFMLTARMYVYELTLHVIPMDAFQDSNRHMVLFDLLIVLTPLDAA